MTTLSPADRLVAALDPGAAPEEAVAGLWTAVGRLRGVPARGLALAAGTRIDSAWSRRFAALVAEAEAREQRLVIAWDSVAVASEAVLAWGSCLAALELARPAIHLVCGPLEAPLALAAGRGIAILVEDQGALSLTGARARKASLGLASDGTGFQPSLWLSARDDLEAARLAREAVSALEDGRLESADPSERPSPELETAALRLSGPEVAAGAFSMALVVRALVDEGEMLRLGSEDSTMLTALARLGGRRIALLGNEPGVRSGALDAEGARRASALLELVGAELPLLLLVDTPGLAPTAEGSAEAAQREVVAALGAALAKRASESGAPLVRLVTRRAYGAAASVLLGGTGGVRVAWRGARFGTKSQSIPAESLSPALDRVVDPRHSRALLTELLAAQGSSAR